MTVFYQSPVVHVTRRYKEGAALHYKILRQDFFSLVDLRRKNQI